MKQVSSRQQVVQQLLLSLLLVLIFYLIHKQMILVQVHWSLVELRANIRDVAFRNVNSGAVLSSFTGLTNLRNLTITFNNAAIAFPAVTLTNSGNLSATAGGAITQTGALTVPGTSSFTAGANAIDFNNQWCKQ